MPGFEKKIIQPVHFSFPHLIQGKIHYILCGNDVTLFSVLLLEPLCSPYEVGRSGEGRGWGEGFVEWLESMPTYLGGWRWTACWLSGRRCWTRRARSSPVVRTFVAPARDNLKGLSEDISNLYNSFLKIIRSVVVLHLVLIRRKKTREISKRSMWDERDSSTRFLASGFFNESTPYRPLSHTLHYFRIRFRTRGDIRI